MPYAVMWCDAIQFIEKDKCINNHRGHRGHLQLDNWFTVGILKSCSLHRSDAPLGTLPSNTAAPAALALDFQRCAVWRYFAIVCVQMDLQVDLPDAGFNKTQRTLKWRLASRFNLSEKLNRKRRRGIQPTAVSPRRPRFQSTLFPQTYLLKVPYSIFHSFLFLAGFQNSNSCALQGKGSARRLLGMSCVGSG